MAAVVGLFFLPDQVTATGRFLEGINQAGGIAHVRPVGFVRADAHVIVEVAAKQGDQFAGAGDVVDEGFPCLIFAALASGFRGVDQRCLHGGVFAPPAKIIEG